MDAEQPCDSREKRRKPVSRRDRSLFNWSAPLAVLTIVMLAGALFRERARVRNLRYSLMDQKETEEHVARIAAINQLTGTSLPPVLVRTLSGEQVDLLDVIANRPTWIIDVEECVSCLDVVGDWNSAAAKGILGVVVLMGVNLERASKIRDGARILLPVYVDSHRQLGRSMQLRLPSTHLLVNDNGTVLLIDTFSRHSRCEWNFPAQVSAIRGDNKDVRIRAPP